MRVGNRKNQMSMTVHDRLADFSGAMASDKAVAARRTVAMWLLGCCAMIFAMVVIGGVTRLTESGLSIVRWDPVAGSLPPLSDAAWAAEFDAYKSSPQYREVNRGMDLAAFKTIYWWEYIHRLWGRLIGVVFLLPFLWFLATGRIGRRLRAPLAGLFVLGGLQGAVGWWMVASGLVNVPAVSAYRLTTHLGLALTIYAMTLWLALGLLSRGRAIASAPARLAARLAWAPVALTALTIAAGGFVAGLDAGLIYNEFPLMGDGLIPSDYRNPALSALANVFENHAAVQFHHRVLGMATVAVVLAFAVLVWRRVQDRTARYFALGAGAMAVAQACLGIATLLLHVPVPLGAAHQAGSVALLTLVLLTAHRLRRV
jgi:heme a synthase